MGSEMCIRDSAFNSLLDKSRFQMIILDEKLKPLYHNKSASKLFKSLQERSSGVLKQELVKKIRLAIDSQTQQQNNSMQVLDFADHSGGHLYVRTIVSQVSGAAISSQFHILMTLNPSADYISLHPDLVSQYGLTEKEQNVLMRLVHGDNIKQIADSSFVTQNTIRSHLKAIFRKTEVKSQGALISLILTHESQVLDSYFNSDITTVIHQAGSADDESITLSCGLTAVSYTHLTLPTIYSV